MNEKRFMLSQVSEMLNQTDLARVKTLTEGEITASMQNDPDWQADLDNDITPIDFQFEAKQAISIRLDKDVLTFFKGKGRGYQTHINAILRRYMEKSVG